MNKQRFAFGTIGGLALSLVMAAALLAPAAAVSQTLGVASQPEATRPSRLVLLSKLDGPPLPADLLVLEDYDAFVLAEVSEAQLAALPEANVMDRMADRTVISLNGTVWDTRQGEPAVPDDLRAADDDPYFLIQFYAPVKNEWVTGLEALGVTFLGYHPNYTYIVRMDPALMPRVQAAHAVQWVGRYHPAYRLAPEEEIAKALAYDGRIALVVRGFPGMDVAVLRVGLEKASASVWLVESLEPPVVRVWAAPELLAQLAALPGVYWIEAYDPPELHNDKAAQTMDTWNVWRAGRNGLLQDLMGAGQIAGMVDSGLDNKSTNPTIEDFYDYTGGTTTSRVVYNQNGAGCGGFCPCTTTDNLSGHGTHVAGSIVGNGYNSLAQRGLTAYATAADPSFDYAWAVGQAPEARIAVIHAGGTSGGICVSAQTDWVNLYNQGARNVNNSWGNTFYYYGGNSRTADYVMWIYQDYLVVTSAGNAGQATNTLSQPANAKNTVTVGAALNHRSPWILTSEASNLLTYFSSRGPVNLSGGDGRAKPDVIAPGADVLSTRSNYLSTPSTVGLWGNEPGDGDDDGRPDYAWSGGTSMSSPLVTGAATILRDYFQDIQGLGSTTPPSAALIKAALVNGAVDMGYGYESLASPPAGKVYYGGRNLQGWGFVNVEQSITPRAPRSFFFDDFTNITNSAHQSTMGSNSTGDYVQYTIVVADSSEPLKVTLTWTDYQGGSSSYAVNNLNLLVTAPGGATYYGNNFSGSWSVTGGSYDAKNNTEAVYLQNPTAGTWTVRVTDASHGSGTQPFALFVSGGLGTNPSWTRTCSGTAGTCANARGGTSGQTYGGTAVNYFPSLKPLIQPKEHTPAGESFTSSFRLTNWGRSADTISLSSAVTDMTGDSVTNVTVAFSPTGPFALTSGATQDVQVTITVGGAVPKGAYDVMITAASAGTGSRKDAMVIPLNVLPNGDLSNEMRVVSLPGAQVMLDFWATGQTLWAGYLSGEDHNNGEGVVWASCSTDGGTTWTDVGLVSAEDGAHYYGPAIAGNSTGSSVTFVWVKANLAVYARTWTRTSGCTGTWRSIQTLATYPGGNYRIAYPDVIYDTDGTILVTWRKNDNASGGADGIFSNQSTNDGASYGTAAGVPDASGTDATHTMPQLTLDTTRNEVWMAYRNSSNSGDVRLKRWVGSSNSWDAAGTRHISVAATTDVETRPGIGYVAATNSLWVTWHRYASAANATARLYYVRSSAGTLPDPTWGATQQYPVGVRTAELHPAMVVGDASYAYISYLAYNDALRGGNAYALRAPAAGGAPDMTYQLSATVDDPPLYARGNAGSPRLMWATTTVNGSSSTGPALLYTKNPPNSGNPDYGGNLGVAQTLYNLEENLDVYLSQVGVSPTAVELARFEGWPEGLAIHVEWETVTEIDNLGFNLYRAGSPDGPYVKLNEELIPSQAPGSPVGAVYVWLDEAVQAGQTYYYKLEDVDVYGHTTMHGPVEVRAGPTLRTRP